jgi:glycine betaine/proline transport system substrate-binding protein
MRYQFREWRALAGMALIGASGVVAEAGAAAIRLVENPWPASALNVAVASQLLKNELGREVATVAADEKAQWDLLAKGEAEAVLELWPSGHAAAWRTHVLERRDVVSGGELGVRGRIGWFTTRATVDKHPEVASWRGLGRDGKAAVFAAKGGDGAGGGRGRLLTGDPSWTQFDAEIIRNLGLELEVKPLGSEAALVAEVRRAAGVGEPVLFYFYTPHALFKELDLVMVELPKHDAEQWKKAGNGGAACAYPEEALTKLFATGLAKTDAGAEAFLRAVRYDNAAQIAMLAEVEKGKTPAEAAASWIAAHGGIWRAWVAAARAVKATEPASR